MKVIGLAGEPGCGKSAVARALAERNGIAWIDMDWLSWETYRPGGPAYDRLIARFGKGILLPSGEVDRSALGRIVFSDDGALADLNAIVHPELTKKLCSIIAQEKTVGTRILLVEGALLGISPYVDYSLFDAIIWLTASEQTRAQRLRTAGRAHHIRRHLPVPRAAETIEVDAEGSVAQTARLVLGVIGSLTQK